MPVTTPCDRMKRLLAAVERKTHPEVQVAFADTGFRVDGPRGTSLREGPDPTNALATAAMMAAPDKRVTRSRSDGTCGTRLAEPVASCCTVG